MDVIKPQPPTRTPAWAKNMRKLSPGVYAQGDAIHVNGPEICKDLGLP